MYLLLNATYRLLLTYMEVTWFQKLILNLKNDKIKYIGIKISINSFMEKI